MGKKRYLATIIIIFLALFILAAALYFTFFYAYSCDDLSCFQEHQKTCSRVLFVNDNADTQWLYEIKGRSEGLCKINVKVMQVKKGSVERRVLEGKDMNCYLTIGSLASPEGDVSKCHGLLREEIQEIIIQKLHSQIVENIDEIGKELGSLGGLGVSGVIPEENTSEDSMNSS